MPTPNTATYRLVGAGLVGAGLGLVLILSSPARVAAELIPTPEFSNHAIPTVTVPAANSAIWAAVDVIALLGALSLASYLALVSRSRRQLLLLTIVSLFWFGFYRSSRDKIRE
jgi:hypothetical protein